MIIYLCDLCSSIHMLFAIGRAWAPALAHKCQRAGCLGFKILPGALSRDAPSVAGGLQHVHKPDVVIPGYIRRAPPAAGHVNVCKQRPGRGHVRQRLTLDLEVIKIGQQPQAGNGALLDERLAFSQAGADIGFALVEMFQCQRNSTLRPNAKTSAM